MNVLVLNCGSSSVKFQRIATDLERTQDSDKRLAHGVIERIGGTGVITFTAVARGIVSHSVQLIQE